jgi:hypothetical protein
MRLVVGTVDEVAKDVEAPRETQHHHHQFVKRFEQDNIGA